MHQVENLLSEESLQALRTLKGQRLVTLFAANKRLEGFAPLFIVVQTEREDVCLALHEGAFRHPLTYDVSTMTARRGRYVTPGSRAGYRLCADVCPEPFGLCAHPIGQTIRRVVVLMENFWYNDPNEDDSGALTLPEEEKVYLREPRVVVLVLDDETLLFDKCGDGWGDTWVISRTPGTEPRHPRDFTIHEAIEL